MKKSKLLIVLMVLLLMVSVFAACGAKEEESVQLPVNPPAETNNNQAEPPPIPEDVTIGISIPSATHGWTMGVIYYADTYVKVVTEKNGWDYQLVLADDANDQANQIELLIADGVDVIVMLPFDGASLYSAALAVEEAGIPLVVFDREIPDFIPTALVKGDNEGMGVEAAKYINEKFPDGTSVLDFMGDASTVPQQRQSGFESTINSNINHTQVGYTNWQREAARNLFEDWVNGHSQDEIDEIGAVYTHDDEVALGILDALEAFEADASFTKTFDNLKVITGGGGSQAFYTKIAESENYDIITLLYAPNMIEEAIDVGVHIVKGLPYLDELVVPSEAVSKENVADYINEEAPY